MKLSRVSRKKWIAWLLAVCLCLQLAPLVQAADDPDAAPDLDSDTVQASDAGQAAESPAAEMSLQDAMELLADPQAEAPEDSLPAGTDGKDPTPATGMDAFVLEPDQISCSFQDVPAAAWYYNPVAYASSLGLVNGRTPASFDPEATISIAEGIALAVRVYEKYHGITEEMVREPGTAWYTPYVERALEYGILPDGMADYTAPMTRQQAAALFYYMLPEEELSAINTISDLPDVGKNNPYYAEILALYNAGVLTGMEPTYGTFQPSRTIKRSEFVKLLYALIVPAARKTQSFTSYTGMAAFDIDRYDVTCTFTDVAQSAWYYDEVAAQQTLGLFNGRTPTTFAPNDNVTLAETAALSVRIYQKYHGITTGIPDRQAGEAWYGPYIRLAIEYGILPADWTSYTAPLSRNRVAYLMYHTLPAEELPAINEITELPDMDDTYIGYAEVLALYNAGVLTGNDSYGTFAPATPITRAQLAALLTRLIDPDYRVQFTLNEEALGQRIVYGTSGAGRELEAYRFGTGKNVMVIGFATHGYEDNFAKDGQELVYTAESLMSVLKANMNTVNSGDWSVYVLPCINPDGLHDGYTNSGPGRCTTSYFTTAGTLSANHGVDINRSFPTNFVVQTSARYYTGAAPLSCKESRALASFVRSVRGSGTNVCIDTHGWTQQIITSTGTGGLLYQTFHNAFGQNTYANCTNANGYFTAYTTSLGYDSCLFEFPGGIYSHNAFLSSGYSAKYISCIMTLLNKY